MQGADVTQFSAHTVATLSLRSVLYFTSLCLFIRRSASLTRGLFSTICECSTVLWFLCWRWILEVESPPFFSSLILVRTLAKNLVYMCTINKVLSEKDYLYGPILELSITFYEYVLASFEFCSLILGGFYELFFIFYPAFVIQSKHTTLQWFFEGICMEDLYLYYLGSEMALSNTEISEP